MKFVTAHQLKDMLESDMEIALLDVRERGPFSKEHLLLSCCVPLSQLETMIGDLVPRYSTKIIIMDEGPSGVYQLDKKAANRLTELGYTDISILRGGIAGWRNAGFKLFSGVNVLSKAFGEIVANTYETPFVNAQQEHDRIDNGEEHVILDSRPGNEYHRMTIPRSINAPGAELVYRVHDVVPDSSTLIVVHCAGRTRSIIGAQSLINAGIPNPVVALENGTMGWQLAGFELEYGQARFASPPSPQGLAKAKECAARVEAKFGVKKAAYPLLKDWMAQTDDRSLYLIDVRLPEEFEAGHLEGSRNVQGGQLIQATDEYIGVHNARVVLLDDTEVRAIMTASWLIQMGWPDVYVLENGVGNLPLVQGLHKPEVRGFEKADTLAPRELDEKLANSEEVAVLDLASSACHSEQHVPRAWWGIRSRLGIELSKLPQTKTLVLTSEDGILAHLAARDLKALKFEPEVLVLEGGTKAWINAGLPTSKGMEQPLSELEDIWYMPYMFPDAPVRAKRGYLEWEIALAEQVERGCGVKFRKFSNE